MQSSETAPRVAIACGGTGGHLFPGLAVADWLIQSGCAIQLLISPRDVDRHGVPSASGMEIITLPAVGLQRRAPIAFLRGLWKSYRVARAAFGRRPPAAVLAMGGFTSVAPILAGRKAGVPTFLHESNSIPGRANRLLAPWVDRVFVGFQSAAKRITNARVTVTGTPVRAGIYPRDAAACRSSLGFDPDRPLLLIIGGSQGASAINNILVSSLPLFSSRIPNLQFLHVTGPRDFAQVNAAYAARQLKAVVRTFLPEIEAALGAATAAVSRAGASSLAEFAAALLPAVLIPLPASADNHQFLNATALVDTGAARLLEQSRAAPELLVAAVEELVVNSNGRDSIKSALSHWHHPAAAQQIATQILTAMEEKGWRAGSPAEVRTQLSSPAPCDSDRAEVRNLAAA